MKFGRIVYRYISETFRDSGMMFNIGDVIQTLAIDYIYERLGIEKCDIVNINLEEMNDYDGAYVIVVMEGGVGGSNYKRFNHLPSSEKIIPVFISFEMSDETCDDLIPYLKNHEPIGCRDEATMNLLRRKGVEAFLSGCLTITLPKREQEIQNGKVFFVDIPTKLERYIPKELKENCEYITHEEKIKSVPMQEEEYIMFENLAKHALDRYRNEAKLVVTSRLHAAVPCIAMGIPVILAIDNIDSRFSWLDKIIPLYDSESYHKIDWNPNSVAIEDLKEDMIKVVEQRITEVRRKKEALYDLSAFWENREKVMYNRKLQLRLEDLKSKYEVEEEFDYVIWGAGIHGKLAYTMINEYFKKANLIAVVDNYVEGKLFGVDVVKPQKVKNLHIDYAIVTTHTGRFEAVEILNEMKKEKGKDWCYFISKDIPEENFENEDKGK